MRDFERNMCMSVLFRESTMGIWSRMGTSRSRSRKIKPNCLWQYRAERVKKSNTPWFMAASMMFTAVTPDGKILLISGLMSPSRINMSMSSYTWWRCMLMARLLKPLYNTLPFWILSTSSTCWPCNRLLWRITAPHENTCIDDFASGNQMRLSKGLRPTIITEYDDNPFLTYDCSEPDLWSWSIKGGVTRMFSRSSYIVLDFPQFGSPTTTANSRLQLTHSCKRISSFSCFMDMHCLPVNKTWVKLQYKDSLSVVNEHSSYHDTLKTL